MTQLNRLANWVQMKHNGQLIRRTSEPYFNHLLAVAEMAGARVRLGYEIGLCHDLFEDTNVESQDLLEVLDLLDYKKADAVLITDSVVALTDHFTADAYPELSKSNRKKLESARLVDISAIAQTVKYADLIYNAIWVLKYDHKHAKHYFRKKKKLLKKMTAGDTVLWREAMQLLERKEK